MDEVLRIYSDNQQTIRLLTSNNPQLSTKLRHVDVHQHWLRREFQLGEVDIDWICRRYEGRWIHQASASPVLRQVHSTAQPGRYTDRDASTDDALSVAAAWKVCGTMVWPRVRRGPKHHDLVATSIQTQPCGALRALTGPQWQRVQFFHVSVLPRTASAFTGRWTVRDTHLLLCCPSIAGIEA
jgi:hypothetical protein